MGRSNAFASQGLTECASELVGSTHVQMAPLEPSDPCFEWPPSNVLVEHFVFFSDAITWKDHVFDGF